MRLPGPRSPNENTPNCHLDYSATRTVIGSRSPTKTKFIAKENESLLTAKGARKLSYVLGTERREHLAPYRSRNVIIQHHTLRCGTRPNLSIRYRTTRAPWPVWAPWPVHLLKIPAHINGAQSTIQHAESTGAPQPFPLSKIHHSYIPKQLRFVPMPTTPTQQMERLSSITNWVQETARAPWPLPLQEIHHSWYPT